jgi:hypothetical protein
MRSPRAKSRIFLACSVAMAGCVGQPTPGPGGGTPDAHVKMDAGGLADARPADAAPFMCRNKITMGLDNGHHNPGQNCQQGCHNHNFSMSGTLYSSAAGGAPVVGASITFIDANGVTGDMQTNLNGNFWWALPVAFPVKIIASMCPDIQPMVSMVTSTGGGCNQAGCHSGGGGPGRVHLP